MPDANPHKDLEAAQERVRISRDAMDASTFCGRSRTAEAQREVTRLRDLLQGKG